MHHRPPALVSADGVTPLRAMAARGGANFRAGDVMSQSLATWTPLPKSADAAYLPERDTITGRVQDLARNNGWASGLLQRYVDQAIGANWRISWRPDLEAMGLDPAAWRGWIRSVERKFRAYANDPRRPFDVTGRFSFAQQIGLAFRHRLADGEALALPLFMEGRPGQRYRTTLQTISPDRLSNPQGMMDGARLRGGVERDTYGRPLAFHIRRSHPSDYSWDAAGDTYAWDRIPAETPWGRRSVLHYFEPTDAEQTRGQSLLAAAVEPLQMSGKYSRTELQAALLNAILAAYIKSPMDHNVLAASLGTSNAIDAVAGYQGLRSDFNEARPILLDGMQIPQFFPGDELVFADAKRPNGAFGEFQRSVLQNVAAATGTSYEQLAQDWSRTNYSSARAALLEAWKFLVARKNHFSDGWLTPIFALWLEDAVDLGEVELPPGSPSFWEGYGFWLQCRWTIGPGRGWVDPTKEAQASQMRMDSGLSTWEDEAADQGRDWEETAEQLAYEQDRRRALGLPNPTSTTVTEPPVDDQDVADDAETRDQDGGDPPRAARPGRSRIPVSGHP